MQILTESHYPTEFSWSEDMKFIFLLKGRLHMQVETQVYSIHENDFFFIRPYELFAAMEDGNYIAFEVAAEKEDLVHIAPSIDSMHFDLKLIKANAELPVYNALAANMADIHYHSETGKVSSKTTMHKCLCGIIEILINNLESKDHITPDNSSEKHNRQMFEILKYISIHYSEQISLESIAGAMGFHPQYFSAYFKKHFGSNFLEYLNTYRVNQSFSALVSTNDSIIDIAIAHGFNNHKTYNNAFKKVVPGMTPREYRLKRQKPALDNKSESGFINDDIYKTLRLYRSMNDSSEKTSASVFTAQVITVSGGNSVLSNHTHKSITIGRAISVLRYDIQEQLRKAKQDLNIEYVRIRDIFSDNLFVYFEDEDKNPTFSWKALDEVFDFLLSIGLRPFAEIGYMPAQLASKKQYAGWQYHPNVSFPKSTEKWQLLITSFFRHLISRYGIHEVRKWPFSFWTNPNLRLINGYWYESKEKFFEFYRITYEAIKSVDCELMFGSPNFSYPTGLEWYEDFFEFSAKHNIKPSYLSAHLYGCSDGMENDKEGYEREFLEYRSVGGNAKLPDISPQKKYLKNAVSSLKRIISTGAFSSLPITIDDCNITFIPTDYTRDTCFMAPFILDTYFDICQDVFLFSFNALSDIHEDFFYTDLLYHGGPGLLDFHSIPKAGYYALSMAYNFNSEIIERGENYVIAQNDNGFEMLIYNLDFYNRDYHGADPSAVTYNQRYNVFEAIHPISCHIKLPAECGNYNIIKRRINRKSGSSYDEWVKMGSPKELSPELSDYLKSISIPEVHFESVTAGSKFLSFEELIPPHGVVHISITRKF